MFLREDKKDYLIRNNHVLIRQEIIGKMGRTKNIPRPSGSEVVTKLKRELEKSVKEREKLKISLKEIEEKLNTIMRNVSDIVYMLDNNGFITFISDRIEQFGFNPMELVGVNIFEIIHPCEREKATYRINERRTGERGTREYEIHLLTKDQMIEEQSKNNIESAPLLSVTANGHYSYSGEEKISFVGTIGIFRDKAVHKIFTTEEQKKYIDKKMVQLVEIYGDEVIIPICAKCKKIRLKDECWEQIETFISKYSQMKFTHTICPVCAKILYPDINKEE